MAANNKELAEESFKKSLYKYALYDFENENPIKSKDKTDKKKKEEFERLFHRSYDAVSKACAGKNTDDALYEIFGLRPSSDGLWDEIVMTALPFVVYDDLNEMQKLVYRIKFQTIIPSGYKKDIVQNARFVYEIKKIAFYEARTVPYKIDKGSHEHLPFLPIVYSEKNKMGKLQDKYMYPSVCTDLYNYIFKDKDNASFFSTPFECNGEKNVKLYICNEILSKTKLAVLNSTYKLWGLSSRWVWDNVLDINCLESIHKYMRKYDLSIDNIKGYIRCLMKCKIPSLRRIINSTIIEQYCNWLCQLKAEKTLVQNEEFLDAMEELMDDANKRMLFSTHLLYDQISKEFIPDKKAKKSEELKGYGQIAYEMLDC